MKASELAIGDWVCVAGPVINGEERQTPPMRVVSIGETWVCLRIDPEQGDPFEHDIYEIRPIPLTADILIANGWKRIPPERLRWEYRKNGSVTAAVEVEIWHEGPIYTEIWASGYSMRLPTLHVHQLQHALRLAGIEKKIEL